jgi:hypothetical protein
LTLRSFRTDFTPDTCHAVHEAWLAVGQSFDLARERDHTGVRFDPDAQVSSGRLAGELFLHSVVDRVVFVVDRVPSKRRHHLEFVLDGGDAGNAAGDLFGGHL